MKILSETEKRYRKRLLYLAKVLETKVPRKQFDYTTWIGDEWKGKADLSCGTKACALGWAAATPAFNKIGLRLRPYRGHDGIPDYTDAIVYKDGYGEEHRDPTDIIPMVFGPNTEDLFQPEDGVEERATPKQVAKKIREWVAENYPE